MITHQSSLEKFHQQLQYVQDRYTNHGLSASRFSNVLIGGMGGSGIGATIAKSFFAREFPLPVEIVNDYDLPGYVGDKTLVILGSYSGNTEETLELYEEALKRGSHLIVLTTGGELMEKARAGGATVYVIEGGFQPRMALGYSLGFLIRIMAELAGKEINPSMQEAIEKLRNNSALKSAAESLVKKFQSTLRQRYTILTDAALYGVAVRFAQQLNENAKQEAFVNVLPEANHNVIESYYGKLPSNFIVLNSQSNERVSMRFSFVVSLLEREYNKVAIFESEGVELSTLFELIHILDWFSILITEPLNVNPMEIENIVSLKEFLAEA